jgi:hypothetical protein
MTERLAIAVDEILRRAGFATDRRHLPIPKPSSPGPETRLRLAPSDVGFDVLLAEHPKVFAVIHWTERWSELEPHAEDLVSAAAALAEDIDRSPRLWDLTVVVLTTARLTDEERFSAVPWSMQTRYARRVLADAVTEASLASKLGPLLPLDIALGIRAERGPLEDLLADLTAAVGPLVAQAAVRSFQRMGRVELP